MKESVRVFVCEEYGMSTNSYTRFVVFEKHMSKTKPYDDGMQEFIDASKKITEEFFLTRNNYNQF